MDTFENQARRERERELYMGEDTSGIKHKLGQLGRRIKRIDLRSQIIEHPLAAVGIAAGLGVVAGIARPMPRRGRMSGALIAMLSTIGYRLVRDAAMVHVAEYAKQRMTGSHGSEESHAQKQGGGSTPYTRY